MRLYRPDAVPAMGRYGACGYRAVIGLRLQGRHWPAANDWPGSGVAAAYDRPGSGVAAAYAPIWFSCSASSAACM